MGDYTDAEAEGQEAAPRLETWACFNREIPEPKVVFAAGDIGGPGTEWTCFRGAVVVDTARALETLDHELYKLFQRVKEPLP